MLDNATTTRAAFHLLATEHRVVPVTRKVLADSPAHLWGQVCAYARQHSAPEKQAGRAWHLFNKIIGSPPPKSYQFASTPNTEITRNVRNKITSLNVAFSRGKAA